MIERAWFSAFALGAVAVATSTFTGCAREAPETGVSRDELGLAECAAAASKPEDYQNCIDAFRTCADAVTAKPGTAEYGEALRACATDSTSIPTIDASAPPKPPGPDVDAGGAPRPPGPDVDAAAPPKPPRPDFDAGFPYPRFDAGGP
jgi:hypothetical protein